MDDDEFNEEDLDFENYEDDGDGGIDDNDPNVQIQNLYFNSKGQREESPHEALEGFKNILDIESEKGEWGFKALKEIVKLEFKQKNYSSMMKYYLKLLTYVKSAVTRNQSEKSINSILDRVGNCEDAELLQKFYEATLETLKETKNDRLWFKTNLKLAKLWFDRHDFNKLSRILKELYKSCQNEDGTEDIKKDSQLLEIYALEIQMCTETKNTKRLKELYEKSKRFDAAITHPRVKGVIRESGGKMYMSEGRWNEAYTDFFEAFKCYDEAGIPRRVHCLKYVVLANLMSLSKINPFDSDEAKSYKNDPEIIAFTNLMAAYYNNDIIEIQKIISENRSAILDDPFIRQYIEQLIKQVRTKALLNLIGPYTRMTIPFICKELNASEEDVESLLVSMILDNKIRGRIDQVNRSVTLDNQKRTLTRDYNALDKYSRQVESLVNTIFNVKIKKVNE